MSADEFICPKCIEIAEKKRESAYGKVSEDEYFVMLGRAEESQNNDTLQEKYQIGVDIDGEFYVSYSCHCSICDFKFDYKYSQKLLVDK